MGKKKYVPNPKYNSVVQAAKLDKLQLRIDASYKEIEKSARNSEMLTKLYNKQVDYLSNFARHDMKNAIQSMDSILSTTSPEEFTEEVIQSLKSNLKNIRQTVDNFSKLVPYSVNGKFTIDTLIVGAQLLVRSELYQKGITATFNFPRTSKVTINQPFQGLLLMLYNLITNAIKALENVTEKNLLIDVKVDNNECIIKIADSGVEILPENSETIFNYGYTTTEGTGIGLYHAKFICEKIKGDIVVVLNPRKGFTKEFVINFPVESDYHATGSYDSEVS